MVKKSSLLAKEKQVAPADTEPLQAAPVFAEAVQIVSRHLNVPIAFVGAMQADAQLFKASVGFASLGQLNALLRTKQLPHDESLCLQVMQKCQPLLIPDTQANPLFNQHPLTQKYKIRAYLGVPLIGQTGQCLGTLAVMDLVPRSFDDRAIEFLTLASRWCMSEYAHLYGAQSKRLVTELSVTPCQQELSADKVRQTLLSECIQNLRTPLTTILGMTGMVNREVYGPLSPKQKEYLDIVAQSGQELLALSDEMLELSLLEATSPGLRVTTTDIEWLCQQTLHPLQQVAQRLGQQLLLTMEPGQRHYNLDKEKVRFMLHYLVVYMMQQSHPGSQIHLHISHVEEGLNLSVWATHSWITDQGVDDSMQSDQVEDSDSMALSLGLQFSQQLAKLHGGQWSLKGASNSAVIFLPAMGD